MLAVYRNSSCLGNFLRSLFDIYHWFWVFTHTASELMVVSCKNFASMRVLSHIMLSLQVSIRQLLVVRREEWVSLEWVVQC